MKIAVNHHLLISFREIDVSYFPVFVKYSIGSTIVMHYKLVDGKTYMIK